MCRFLVYTKEIVVERFLIIIVHENKTHEIKIFIYIYIYDILNYMSVLT